MKRFSILIVFLLFALPAFGSEGDELDELTGVLKKNAKALSSCLLKIDGSYSIGLRGDILKTIPDGARIWVKGELHTTFYDNRGNSSPAMMPIQWHIFMVVKECKIVSKAFERPRKKQTAEQTDAPPTQPGPKITRNQAVHIARKHLDDEPFSNSIDTTRMTVKYCPHHGPPKAPFACWKVDFAKVGSQEISAGTGLWAEGYHVLVNPNTGEVKEASQYER